MSTLLPTLPQLGALANLFSCSPSLLPTLSHHLRNAVPPLPSHHHDTNDFSNLPAQPQNICSLADRRFSGISYAMPALLHIVQELGPTCPLFVFLIN